MHTNPDPQPEARSARLIDGILEASVVGSFTRIGPAIRRRVEGWETFSSTPGRVVVITGASSGLGREAAIELGHLGCTVVCVSRDRSRLDEVVSTIVDGGGVALAEVADLADLEATAALAERLRRSMPAIDVLVHDAGALHAQRRVGPQGIEVTVTVHVLSPYLLTELVRPALTEQAKVITMTSGGMYTEAFDIERLEMGESDYRGSVAYARAKRAQVVLTSAWQRHEPAGAIGFYAVHPGWARTPGLTESLPTFAKVAGPLLRTPGEGVDTLVWLATSPVGEPVGGQLWLDRRPRRVSRLRRTAVDEATRLVQEDELLTWLAETTAPYRDEEE